MDIFKEIVKHIIYLSNFLWNSVQLKKQHVKYDSTLRINGRICIFGTGIRIGKNVRINCGYRANPIGGDTRTILRTDTQGIIKIDDNAGISNSTIVAYQEVKIGKNVLIGGSCKIYNTDFHSLDAYTRINYPTNDIISKAVVINDNIFIGAYSIVLKGVTIGPNSIVGAGSAVAKSIPAGEVWDGNPAKFVRALEG